MKDEKLMSTDVSVIILIGQEKLHMRRCVERLQALAPQKIFVVASQPDDGSEGIAKATAAECGLNLEVVFNAWPGNQALQFNWALDHLKVETTWILRLDADEYLLPKTIDEVKEIAARTDAHISAFSMSLSRRWFGRKIRYGSPTLWVTRLFRTGCGRYPDGAEMDEHLVIEAGEVRRMGGQFVDESSMSFEDWKAKHRNYARREARAYMQRRLGQGVVSGKKVLYDKLPLFVRTIVYWGVRYVFMCGFLDGWAGLSWNFWQGFWYRWLVDREIVVLKRSMN